MNLVDFDTYIKIIGSIGILSLISQITSFFKVIDEMKKAGSEIENKRKGHARFRDNIERDLQALPSLKNYLIQFIALFGFCFASVIVYSLGKNISLLSDAKWYQGFIYLLNYGSLILLPIWYFTLIYKLFLLYNRLLDYKNSSDIYNHV